MPKLKSSRSGYTLIELLVVITISTILITLGVSAYRKSADRQAVRADNEKIVATLTQAQKAATTGKTDCSGLYQGEKISVTAGSSTINIQSICEGGNGTNRTTDLANSTFASTESLTFRPLNQGVDTGSTSTKNIDYTSSSVTYRIQIDSSGTVKSIGQVNP